MVSIFDFLSQPQGINPNAQAAPQMQQTIAPQSISRRVQEWLGAKDANEGGSIQEILANRLNRRGSDYVEAAGRTLNSGQYQSGNQVYNERFTGAMGQLEDLKKSALQERMFQEEMRKNRVNEGMDAQRLNISRQALAQRNQADSAVPSAPSPTIATNLGVPTQPVNFSGLSAKDASMLQRQMMLNAQKRLQSEELTGAAKQARSNISDATRYSQLIDEQGTGGIYAIPGFSAVAGMFDPQISEMRSIQDRLTPQQRVAGSGATSDFDARMFQGALMGVNRPEQANRAIIAAMQAKAQDELEYQQFLSDYYTANQNLNGADAAWQKYVNDNPIFDPTSTTEPKLNEKRMSYQNYFNASGQVGRADAEDPLGIR